MTNAASLEIQTWPIDQLVLYSRNPRKNDAVVDRMCSSIRKFGLKIPVLARSDGEVVDGHLRIKAARELGISDVPVILCDEWSPAQVKAFRLLVNRSVTWASWDEELLALELQELSEADFDLDLTGFNPSKIDGLLALPDDERANATPPGPGSPVSLPGDLWCAQSRRARAASLPLSQQCREVEIGVAETVSGASADHFSKVGTMRRSLMVLIAVSFVAAAQTMVGLPNYGVARKPH